MTKATAFDSILTAIFFFRHRFDRFFVFPFPSYRSHSLSRVHAHFRSLFRFAYTNFECVRDSRFQLKIKWKKWWKTYPSATFAKLKSINFWRASLNLRTKRKKENWRPNESVGEIENAIQFSWYAPFPIELYAFKAVVDVFTAINSSSLRLLCRRGKQKENSSALRTLRRRFG